MEQTQITKTQRAVQYVYSCIDLEDYGQGNLTGLDKINACRKIFYGEKGPEINRIGIQKSAVDWLKGLSTACAVEFTHADIIKTNQTWQLCDDDSAIDEWFNICGKALYRLFEVPEYQSKVIVRADYTGNRWFDKANGNTYHSVKVILEHADGPESTLLVEYEYGYGQQWEQTCTQLTCEYIGLRSTGAYMRHVSESTSIITVDNGYNDVKRKCDLVPHYWTHEEKQIAVRR